MKSFLTKVGALLMAVVFAFAGCQDYDEDIRKVNDQLNANTAELTSITDALDKAIKDLEAKMVADYATKKALADLSAELKAEIDADVAAAQAAIDAAYKAADAVLKAGYESADAALKTELEGKIAAAIKAAQDANDELAATFERALNQMKNSIDETNTMINEVVVPYFQGEIDKINNAIKDLKAADLKNAEDIAKVAADLATAKTEITAAYTAAIKTAVEKLEGKIAEQATALAALKTLHQNDVILLQAAIAENSTDINALKLALKDHIADYKTTVEQLQGAFAEGDEEVKRILTNNLNAHIELYEQTVEDLQGAIGENTAEIELVRGLVRDLTALHTQDVADLQAAIADNTTLANSIKLDLKNHIADYTATVDLLQGAIGENAAAITANLLAINDLKTLHETDIQNLQDVIVILEAALNQETAQRKAADEELEAKLDTLAALHKTDIELLQAAYAEADEALRQQLTNRINALEDDYNATVEQIQNAMSELEARIFANEVGVRDLQAKAAELDQTIADLDAAYKAADEALEDAYKAADKAINETISNVVDQFTNAYQSIEWQINFISLAIQQTIADLNALEVNVGVLTERVQSLVYVPEYNDAKATINYGIAPYLTADNKVETAIVPAKSILRYKVNSTSETAVADIVRAFAQDPSILTYDLENVKLRSAAPELQVVSVREDEQGYLEVTAHAKNFAKEFFYITLTKEVQSYFKEHVSQNHPILNGIFNILFGDGWGTAEVTVTQRPTTSYSAALVLAQADKKNNVASEFTNLIPASKYDVLSLGVKYTDGKNTNVRSSEFRNSVADRNPEWVRTQNVASRDTATVLYTQANTPVISVVGDSNVYTAEELYTKYGYAVDIQKTYQIVSYTKDGKVQVTPEASVPAWNTEIVSLSDTDPRYKINNTTKAAMGTARSVSLYPYSAEYEKSYADRVYSYLEVVDAYYFAGQSVAVVDKIKITKNIVKIKFDDVTVDWSLKTANQLSPDTSNPYTETVKVYDVKYNNIYNLNAMTILDQKTTLNGAENTTPIKLMTITAPTDKVSGKADVFIEKGYKFAAANAEKPNTYTTVWTVAVDDNTDAEVSLNVTFAKIPSAVTVNSNVNLDLVEGQIYFDGKDSLVVDATKVFDKIGYTNNLNNEMFAALTDGNNSVENGASYFDELTQKFVKVEPSAYNLNFAVAENVDNSFVRLYGEQIKDKANVPSTWLFTRTVDTWFDVPFIFNVTATPYLPDAELIRSTEYASSTNEDKVYSVNLDARIVTDVITGKNVYTVVNSDLGYYLNVKGDVNPTQKVTFAVMPDYASTIENSTVNVMPLETPLDNPSVGKIAAYLQKEKSILKWADHGTQVKVKATLWAGAYPIDYATLVLNVVDPLRFIAENIEATRVPRQETVVKIFSGFDLRSSAQDNKGDLYHTQNLINVAAADLASAINPAAVEAYGVKITTTMSTIYEEIGGAMVPYDDSKYTWDSTKGILTLHKDDAVELLNPIVAKILVTFEHNVHATSKACQESKVIEVRFVNPKKAE